ncbi:MAG: M56 family metallopeptidase [Firmicutes bacterium]|nr:M56 family metallopeptidase [Bacillota bacterium]
MNALFLKILNMSITASWLILAVVLARLLLKKAPKWVFCLLWGLVAIRLVCPFSLESSLSLIPSSETIPANIEMQQKPVIDSGITIIDETVNPIITESFTPSPENSANPLQIVIPFVAIVWITGVFIMLVYALISFLRLKGMVRVSVSVGKQIRACDEVKSPFILGVFRPIIYVPSFMSEETLDQVIRHEKAHLQRHDHWWKPLGFLLLAVYWFHPLCWIAYILLCRDIEMACDERVVRDMGKSDIAAYSQALLDCSMPRRTIAACPLAFGEGNVKTRIKSVLNYKKPAFWIIAAALVVCAALAVFLMTDPSGNQPSDGESVINPTDTSSQPSGTAEDPYTMVAVITEIQNGTLLVRPVDGSWELSSSDSFSIPIQHMPASPEPRVGDMLQIKYNGYILETYPASLGEIYSIEVVGRESYGTVFIAHSAYAVHGDSADEAKTQAMMAACLNANTLLNSSFRPLHLPVFKADTKEELDHLKDAFHGVLLLDQGFAEMPSFEAATASYGEAFFREYSLILTYITGDSNLRYGIYDVSFDGSTLCLNVAQINHPETAGDGIAGWFIWVEVLDSQIAECESYDAVCLSNYETCKPPVLMIREGEKSPVEYPTTGYEWNEEASAIIVDAVGPTSPHLYKIKAQQDLLFFTQEPMTFEFSWSRKPSSFSISYYDIHVYETGVDSRSGTIGYAPTEDGITVVFEPDRVYMVAVRWNPDDVYSSHGAATYILIVQDPATELNLSE